MIQYAIMPRLSLNEETVLLSEWYVKEGDTVRAGDKLFCLETDKSTLDVESEYDGVILKRYCGDGAVVKVLSRVCAIGEAGEQAPELPEQAAAEAEAPKAAGAPAAPAAQAAEAPARTGTRFASPRARALAARCGITDFSAVPASGAGGRVLEEDVIRFAASVPAAEPAQSDGRKVPFTRIRQVIARNMAASLQNSAQLTLNAAFDATALKQCRAKFKREQGAYRDVTIGDLIVYGVSRTLPEFPGVNAWIGENELTEFSHVNLGVAVDTERGLMVPTIMDAAEKDLLTVSQETKTLSAGCRAGNLAPDKMQNATFTVSNLGSFGIQSFTPIVNPPQAAILGIGAIDYALRASADGMVCYPACHLSLTIDHRALDGAPGARFLKKLCENLEQIDRLI